MLARSSSNTSMTGYQEISTDASYRGQIVVMTYPLIDNYGANPEDVESRRPWISGLAVRELAPTHSNWRQQSSMHAFLGQHGIPGIQGIDTRALTRTLRIKGHKRGVLRRAPASVANGMDSFTWIRGRAPAAKAWAAEQVQAAKRVLPYSEQRYVARGDHLRPPCGRPRALGALANALSAGRLTAHRALGCRRQDQHRALSGQPRLSRGRFAIRGQRARSRGHRSRRRPGLQRSRRSRTGRIEP